jgi:hypothetical protein
LTIIEFLFEGEHKYLNHTLLYNNYGSWYDDKIKVCVINDVHPQNFNMIQNNIINLITNKIIIHNKIIKPNLKFIVGSNYNESCFSQEFNNNCAHIYFNMDEYDIEKCENIIKQIKNCKDEIINYFGLV